MVTKTIDCATPLGDTLTQEQKAFFHENGIIHFPRFISKDTVAQLWKACEGVQDKWRAAGTKVVNGIPIKWGTDIDGKRIVQRYAFTNQHSPIIAEFLRDPRFSTLLDFVGPAARLGINEKDGMVVNHYINNDKSNFFRMGWHTDSIRDLFLGKKILPMLNVGIHLDDQDPSHGGLRILPGTHRQNLWNFLFRKKSVVDHKPDKNEVAFNIEAGDLTIHDGRCWHRVEQSTLTGEASRRRVMYIPIIAGNYSPKNADSTMPFYHRFSHLVK